MKHIFFLQTLKFKEAGTNKRLTVLQTLRQWFDCQSSQLAAAVVDTDIITSSTEVLFVCLRLSGIMVTV